MVDAAGTGRGGVRIGGCDDARDARVDDSFRQAFAPSAPFIT